MIRFDGLKKTYGRSPVLDGLTCEIKPGTVTLLVGPNGAGKSTALKIAAGVLQPDSGDVVIQEASILKQRQRAQSFLSLLPQGVAFHPKLTVRNVLEFYADVRGAPRSRVDLEIRRWGLEEHANKMSGRLSGGLRQRLGLAVLLMPQTPVLILDEPGISLDPEWRDAMQRILLEEALRGRTVLVATHLLGEWEGRAGACLLCMRGRIVRELDPRNLRSLGLDELNLAVI